MKWKNQRDNCELQLSGEKKMMLTSKTRLIGSKWR